MIYQKYLYDIQIYIFHRFYVIKPNVLNINITFLCLVKYVYLKVDKLRTQNINKAYITIVSSLLPTTRPDCVLRRQSGSICAVSDMDHQGSEINHVK